MTSLAYLVEITQVEYRNNALSVTCMIEKDDGNTSPVDGHNNPVAS